MGRIRNPERHEKMLNFLICVAADPICDSLDTYVGWVLEESDGWSSFEDRFEKGNLSGLWPENAVWEATLIFLEKLLVERILDKEDCNLLLSKEQRILWLGVRLVEERQSLLV